MIKVYTISFYSLSSLTTFLLRVLEVILEHQILQLMLRILTLLILLVEGLLFVYL